MTHEDELFVELPAGRIWVCGACGKTSSTRSGITHGNINAARKSRGWDESCMMHAVLCHSEPSEDGTYRAVEEP